ncbi:MAG: GxxExxY protein [Acidobacteria bacterium]|nr:GxxExxY protein [Acidobacteriota bacterium]
MQQDPPELDALIEQVLAAAFEVANTLGAGFLEKVYERALMVELELRVHPGLSVTDNATPGQRTRQTYDTNPHLRHEPKMTNAFPLSSVAIRSVLIEVTLPMENREIAQLLSETADLMEIAGEDSFRIRSYRNGASAIAGLPERIEDILNNPARNVTEIAGIGKGLASVLKEIAERGSFERRDQMLERYPPTALDLLKIHGLGPHHYSSTTAHRCARNRIAARNMP